jgi:hypothetical protein
VQTRYYRFEDTGEMLEYAVFVSSKAKNDTAKIPLVIALHGRGAQPNNIMGLVRDAAERAGFIVAAPMGYNTRGWYGLQDAGRVRQEREYSEKDVMNGTVMSDQSHSGRSPAVAVRPQSAGRRAAAIVAFAAMSLLLVLLYLPETSREAARSQTDRDDLLAAAELISHWSSPAFPSADESHADLPESFADHAESPDDSAAVPAWMLAAVSLESAAADEEMMDELPPPASDL